MNKHHKLVDIVAVFLVLALLSFSFHSLGVSAAQQPQGPDTMTNLSTETASLNSAYMLNTSGGTFTTLLINITSQTYRWKAYAGNITGRFTLDDSSNNSIYDWSISTLSGEIYATRSDNIDWPLIACANSTHVAAEELALNISASKDDSINRTFISTPDLHNEFYVGNTYIENSTCPSIATYVDNTAQNASFQEILLYDNSSLVYTSLLENHARGFDNNSYDFQMIVPESGLEGQTSPIAYYFYLELV